MQLNTKSPFVSTVVNSWICFFFSDNMYAFNNQIYLSVRVLAGKRCYPEMSKVGERLITKVLFTKGQKKSCQRKAHSLGTWRATLLFCLNGQWEEAITYIWLLMTAGAAFKLIQLEGSQGAGSYSISLSSGYSHLLPEQTIGHIKPGARG